MAFDILLVFVSSVVLHVLQVLQVCCVSKFQQVCHVMFVQLSISVLKYSVSTFSALKSHSLVEKFV